MKMPENKDDIDLDGWNLHRAPRETSEYNLVITIMKVLL